MSKQSNNHNMALSALLLDSSTNFDVLLELARTLKDQGVKQVALYQYFMIGLSQVDDMSPQHDDMLDVLDCIWSNGWGGRQALFDTALTNAQLEDNEDQSS